MRYIFSAFILNVVVYKHRIFSIVTIIISFVVLVGTDIVLGKMRSVLQNPFLIHFCIHQLL